MASVDLQALFSESFRSVLDDLGFSGMVATGAFEGYDYQIGPVVLNPVGVLGLHSPAQRVAVLSRTVGSNSKALVNGLVYGLLYVLPGSRVLLQGYARQARAYKITLGPGCRLDDSLRRSWEWADASS